MFSIVLVILFNNIQAQAPSVPVKLDNPVSVKYLKTHLTKTEPKLFFTPVIERNLKKRIKTDPAVKNYYEAISLNADEIIEQRFLKRELTGKRLLPVAREMLYRMSL